MKITVEKELSSQKRVNNLDNTDRVHDIKAVLSTREGKYDYISNGSVLDENGVEIASFSTNTGGMESRYSFFKKNITKDEQLEVLTEIVGFIKDLKEESETL